MRTIPDSGMPFVFGTIAVLSLAPIAMVVLDALFERGGSIGYGSFKLEIDAASNAALAQATMRKDLGMKATAVWDAESANVIDAIKMATSN
jgi:hypothetical protein